MRRLCRWVCHRWCNPRSLASRAWQCASLRWLAVDTAALRGRSARRADRCCGREDDGALDGNSWAALADPTAPVTGDGTHRAALFTRLCRRAVAGVWESCCCRRVGAVLGQRGEPGAARLARGQVVRAAAGAAVAQGCPPPVLDARRDRDARSRAVSVSAPYLPRGEGGRYAAVPQLLRAEQYPVAPWVGPHKASSACARRRPHAK